LPNEELLLGTDPQSSSEVSVSVTPVTINRRRCAVLIVRDLSALKVANQVRSNFVSMVSHELRTPLNSIHGFIDLLLQGHMGELTDEQHTYLGYTQEGVQQLVSIVEDILFMTRSDLGQFEIKQEEVHFQSLVHQVLRTLQPQAFRAEVVLRNDISNELPALYADPQRIKQVLNNLVENALKYTPPGGTVAVNAQQHDDRFELISVTDTGYGIPIEDRQHIFERFYQSNHSKQSKMGGYGLGLSIAKLIVEQHGGTIGFDTVVDKGTTFSFTIPLYQEPP
jgi:two-component system phosphate regulon sensor histidine kinase PhoR